MVETKSATMLIKSGGFKVVLACDEKVKTEILKKIKQSGLSMREVAQTYQINPNKLYRRLYKQDGQLAELKICELKMTKF